jgi:hypothetical protein
VPTDKANQTSTALCPQKKRREGIRMRESSGKCPMTFLREDNSYFGGPAVFSGSFRWVSSGLGIVNCNQAKISKRKYHLLGCAVLARVLKS